jgi:uncharacterized protein (DUF302 family)
MIEQHREAATSGLVEAAAPHDVAATVARITAALRNHGVPLLATIDHAAAARKAGLSLPDEVVLVFGRATGGTPLMQADPRVGIDLPLRLLVWSDGGTTRVAFRDPTGLTEQFHLAGAAETLARLRGLLDQLVAAAVSTD